MTKINQVYFSHSACPLQFDSTDVFVVVMWGLRLRQVPPGPSFSYYRERMCSESSNTLKTSVHKWHSSPGQGVATPEFNKLHDAHTEWVTGCYRQYSSSPDSPKWVSFWKPSITSECLVSTEHGKKMKYFHLIIISLVLELVLGSVHWTHTPPPPATHTILHGFNYVGTVLQKYLYHRGYWHCATCSVDRGWQCCGD